MSVTLTETAATRVKSFLEKRGHGVGLRLSVKRTGCSGYAYVVDFADAVGEDDHVYASRGVRVVVDEKSLSIVAGTEIDFAKQGLGESFLFRNPNATGECGCGESFAV